MPRSSYATKKAAIERQIARLKKQAESLSAKRRTPQIAAIIKTMREFDITLEDIAAAYGRKGLKSAAARKSAGTKTAKTSLPARYRNPETGATWSGRGRAPRWIMEAETAGKSRDDFLIDAPPSKRKKPSRNATAS